MLRNSGKGFHLRKDPRALRQLMFSVDLGCVNLFWVEWRQTMKVC